MDKPAACLGCPMYHDGKGFVPDEHPEGAEVMLVMQNPGWNEEQVGKPAVGDSGEYLNTHFIPLLGLERQDVSVANILKCRWYNPIKKEKTNDLPSVTGVWNEGKKKWDKALGKTVEQTAVAHCMSAHWLVPKRIKHLMTLGDLSSKVLGKVDSVTQWRGFPAPEKHDGRTVFVSLHPSYLLQHPKMAIPVAIDWKRFKQVIKGTFPAKVPSRTVISSGQWFGPLPEKIDFVTFDLEYNPETKDPFLAGIGYFNAQGDCIGGVQVWTKDVDQDAFRSWLLALFWTYTTVMHNAVADMEVLAKSWHIYAGRFRDLHDTIQMHAVQHSEWSHGLDFCESLYGRHNRMKHLFQTDMLLYNWGDCLTTGYTFHQLRANWKTDPLSFSCYRNENMPVLPIRLESKLRGIRLDTTFLSRMSDTLAVRAQAAQQVAEMYAGISVGSHLQVTTILEKVEKLKLPKGDSGNASIDKDILAELRRKFLDYDPDEEKDGITPEQLLANIERGGHPLLEARGCYQSSEVLRSHFIIPLLKPGVPTNRQHYDPDEFQSICYPDQHSHSQASGRWSTVDPPLPTLPKKLKPMIIPFPDHCFIGFDFDQQELRADAHISLDIPTIEAFKHGYDIHTLNTCDVFKYPYPTDLKDPHKDPVNQGWREVHHWEGKDDRRRTFNKRFVYRIRYRGNPKYAGDIPGTKVLGLSAKDLVEASNNYLAAHPGLKAYWAKNDARILSTRTARTPAIVWSGIEGGSRKRFLSGYGLKSKPGEVPPICREGTNHPFQGLGADALNLSVQVIHKETKDLKRSWGYGAHDSQRWLVERTDADRFQSRVAEIMERPWLVDGRELSLPITMDKPQYAPEEVPHVECISASQ